MQKEQQGGVHVMEQVPGLMALGAQRKADLSGPAGREQYQTSSFKNKQTPLFLLPLTQTITRGS